MKREELNIGDEIYYIWYGSTYQSKIISRGNYTTCRVSSDHGNGDRPITVQYSCIISKILNINSINKTKNNSGMNCCLCNERNEYAESNLKNNSYACFSCRNGHNAWKLRDL